MRRKVISVILALTLAIGSVQIASASKLSDAQSDLDAANSEISSLESQLSSLQSEIDEVDSELVETIANINIIEDDIAEIEDQLEQAEADLEDAEEQEAEQYEAMKTRIKYMYENGTTSYITALLESDSFAEILNKVSYFNEVYDYDRNLLDEYEATVAEVESLIAQVEENKSDLEETQESLEEEKESLESQLDTLEAEESSYEEDLAAAQALADEYEGIIDDLNAAYAAAQASSSSSSSSSGSSSSSSSGSSSSSSSSSSSASGSAVAAYACQFVGNPYVYGGSSLTNGTDCSGFVMSVYAHFGVSLPHSSSALRSVGYGVSTSSMQPGDIVCYSGHVAIYIGNNTIVHASNAKDGIKYSNVYYRSIICVRRIF